ncbi:low molecular weight protein-tyrosine-phosphatase [Mucilaginibacter paludis]|uniref:protein-tyrosine-phosphatase n=1 Tax=Mucilaginibacter paludis DSM 18603 TaxID=714943 RepID=H1Y6P9_9SPHI|nr:low molecular weight protein-tyrosine-phosphatase [Mucilaginibacter paludis]EHQ26841.1 protein tyrosine phosphatase [Mucilaginibacter paludis DSM 18603]
MKILMVCLGNICRSPLAHGVMENLVKKEGLDWTVDSAGTGDWHVGQGPDRRSVAEARSHGIDISGQICRQFSVRDFDDFDLIVVMDQNNRKDVLAQARNQADQKKVRLLLGDRNVPDPYHDDSQFDPVYKMVEAGCRQLIKDLIRGQ